MGKVRPQDLFTDSSDTSSSDDESYTVDYDRYQAASIADGLRNRCVCVRGGTATVQSGEHSQLVTSYNNLVTKLDIGVVECCLPVVKLQHAAIGTEPAACVT